MTVTAESRAATDPHVRREQRRVLAGTMIGTTIEWYDFFIYANAAALVFAPLFFAPAGSEGPVPQIVAFMSIGVSFLFRPLGAIIAGHMGDRIGRKAMLVLTLLVMGLSTTLIGVLPTYAAIGIAAPLMLVLLRILQGLSTGGEWGGAALMAVEHAPAKRRGFFGAFPQLGAAAGLLLATGVTATVTAITGPEAFLAWGWRLPFLFSAVLIVVGIIIRKTISESPAFADIEASRAKSRMPMVEVFRSNWRQVLQATWAYAGINAAAYMVMGGYFLNYGTTQLGMNATQILVVISVVNIAWMAFILWSGTLSDRFGRVRVFQVGMIALIVWLIPLFLLVDTGNIWMFALGLLGLAVGLGIPYGLQSAMFVEMFPANVRYSGASLGYAIGSIIGGGFAPTIAVWLQTSTGSTIPIAVYLIIWAVISLLVVSTVKDRTGKPLLTSNSTFDR
ncbi:MFS transporter [Microbacterium sp. Root61]|uniref:MFS transporter n=1 Tax=Microbacterium sp. Root61 TaxID=1736570 RepID=UPI0006FCA355|nr:MFS transporter [Microbacterium sp. Root61]KRA26025.1 MFS transporter [Microbacterium sp. Root61]